LSEKHNRISFFNKYWVSSIGVFLLSQVFFFLSEKTGLAMNYRDHDGTVFGKLLAAPLFAEWFDWYETPQYNVLTFFFALFFFVPGLISGLKSLFESVRV